MPNKTDLLLEEARRAVRHAEHIRSQMNDILDGYGGAILRGALGQHARYRELVEQAAYEEEQHIQTTAERFESLAGAIGYLVDACYGVLGQVMLEGEKPPSEP